MRTQPHLTMDKTLSPEEILTYQEFSIPVEGLEITTYQLARASWSCRLRRSKFGGRTKIVFKRGKATISCSAGVQEPIVDIPYIFGRIEECFMSYKSLAKGVHEYSDHTMLTELKRRCDLKAKARRIRKRKDKQMEKTLEVKSNVIHLFNFLKRECSPEDATTTCEVLVKKTATNRS